MSSTFRVNAARIQNELGAAHGRLKIRREKLSSGRKIVGAKDGPADYQIAERLRAKLRGLDQADKNLNYGKNVMKVGGGALAQVYDLLATMKERALNSANDTNSELDREAIQREVEAMNEEIDRLAYETEIMGVHPLLDGRMANYKPAEGYISGLGRVDLVRGGDARSPYADGYGTGGGLIIYAEGVTNPDAYLMSTEKFGMAVRVADTAGNTCDIDLNNASSVNSFAPGSLGARLTKTSGSDGSYTYEYKNGDLHFKIVQSYEIVRELNSGGGGEYCDIRYNFVNMGAHDVVFDFRTTADPVFGDILGEPVMDGADVVHSTRKDLSASDGKIVFNPAAFGLSCNVEAVLTGDKIQNPPDAVLLSYLDYGSGGYGPPLLKWGMLDGSLPPRTSVRDEAEHYTVGWLNRAVAAGSSYQMNTMIGVQFPVTGSDAGNKDKLWIQAETRSYDGFYVPLCDATSEALGVDRVNVRTRQGAVRAIGIITAAAERVNTFSGRYGAYQNKMEYASANTTTKIENLTASESAIADADMAKEVLASAKETILAKTAQAMLAQANHSAGDLLQILQK